MFDMLIDNISHASAQGVVGTAVIFIYFAVMIGCIAYRVKKGDHVSHH